MNSMEDKYNKIDNALTIEDAPKRKIFLKNNKYECQGVIVVCTKTTCNYTEHTFDAIYIGKTKRYTSKGKVANNNTFGDIMKCSTINYSEFNGEITL